MRLLCLNIGSSLGSAAAPEQHKVNVPRERLGNGVRWRELCQMPPQSCCRRGAALEAAAPSAAVAVQPVEVLEIDLEESVRQFRMNAAALEQCTPSDSGGAPPLLPATLESLPSRHSDESLEEVPREDPRVSQCAELPGSNSSRKSKVWTGPMRAKRRLPQPPWTEEQSEEKRQRILNSILGCQDECDIAVNSVLDSWLGQITRVDLGGLIKDLGWKRRPDMALAVFRWMQRQRGRLKPQKHVCSLILGVLGRAGMLSPAREIFDVFAESEEGGNVHCFNAMISAYAQSGGLDKAWELFEDMCSRNVQPNEVTFNTLFSGIARSGSSAQGLASIMKNQGVRASTRTYNAMFSVFAKTGDVESATVALQEMRSSGEVPDLFTYNTLISLYSKAGRLDEALDTLNSLKSAGLRPSYVTYTELIQLMSVSSKHEDAIRLVYEMQGAGCKLDLTLYSVAITAFGRAGLVGEAAQLFRRMRQEGLAPNVVTWSSLIQACSSNGMFDEASEYFSEMLASGCEADLALYNLMLSGYAREGLPLKAANVFREMEAKKIIPDAASFNAMIQAHCYVGQKKRAGELYKQMVRAGYRPDKISEAYGVGGRGKKARVPPLQR